MSSLNISDSLTFSEEERDGGGEADVGETGETGLECLEVLELRELCEL